MGLENLVIILRLLSVEEVINTGRLELGQAFLVLENFHSQRKEMHELLFKSVLSFETFNLR